MAIVFTVIPATFPAQAADAVGRSVSDLLEQLEEMNSSPERFSDEWADQLRRIVLIGPEAVPDLVRELDRTSNDMMLRCLGFVLRAIGDQRAIPALIRSIPKTLRPPGSDMDAWSTLLRASQYCCLPNHRQSMAKSQPLYLMTPAAT